MRPPFKIFPSLSNEKITIREIGSDDIQHIIEISYYDAVQAKNAAEAAEMQDRIDRDYLEGNSIHWCIVDNSTNKIVGTCGYYRGFENGAGELGCVLLAEYRGKGLMFPALKLAIDFGLNKMDLDQIKAITDKKNIKAIKLLERLNFINTTDSEDEIEYVFS
jgi:ribosomal-protein-alanine N-acetyltransferase